MDIYEFFRSSDIAEHCKAINHEFSPLDMAIIVYLSDKPIKRKHEAYRQIISEHPDTPIHKSLNFDARESLHEYLRELISREERAIACLTQPEDGAFFLTQAHFNDGHFVKLSEVFSTFEQADTTLRKWWDWDEAEILFERIYKVCLNREHSGELVNTYFELNKNGEIFDFAFWEKEGSFFDTDTLDMIYFHLPVPFRKGDLVTYTYKYKGEGPHVLKWLPHWRNEENKGYEDYISGKRGDGSDMYPILYSMDDGELTVTDGGFPLTWMLCYYKCELEGENRFLKHLSEYIKNGDENLAWLLAVYMKFISEEESNRRGRLFGEWYRELDD
ncbi:hypothetical protein FACS189490_09490 [Clostridia bacterium]|nr:hypothetical protein FACS189490_09490 [Clostridia bacterium]